uniref:Protein kinase domain-containing protein n=1 Tax=Alexandrium catenella TaxID=2925 RepID=A0A7S1M292_ALECA
MFTGGDLIDGLNAHRRVKGRISDAQLAHLARQMVAAVAHVHSLQIVHRDIKGENFLSDRPDIGDPECRVALADFGTAVRIEPGEHLETRVGTPAFWAPEVWTGGYDFLADVWALGVTSFILLTGALPFEGEAQICKPAANGEPPFAVPYFASELCTDFISRCLEKDPRGRPQAAEAAQHLWMSTPQSQAGPLLSSLKAPTSSEVSRGARVALGWLIGGLGAVLVGCCDGLACCLDMLLPPAPEESTPEESQLAERQPTEHLPDAEEIEKQVTELSRQISITSVKLAHTRPPAEQGAESE